MSDKSTYKLRYFDLRGAAELSRVLFAVAGVHYDDHRYSFKFGVPMDFSTVQRPEFDADKAAGVLEANLGRVPLLEVDGVPIGQSRAIERFLARRFGLLGDTDVQAAQIDAIVEHTRDIREAFWKIFGIKDAEEKASATAKWYAEDLPGWYGKLEKVVGPDGFAVGTKTSYADLALWSLLDSTPDKEGAAAAVAHAPKVAAIQHRVAALESVKAWVLKRPETMM